MLAVLVLGWEWAAARSLEFTGQPTAYLAG